MKASIRDKLEQLVERHQEVGALLAEPEVLDDSQRLAELSKEYARLEPVAERLAAYREAEAALAEAEGMGGDADAEIRELAEGEAAAARERLERLEAELHDLLLPEDPEDRGNVFLEIRAGTGGHEAALFAGDLFRMYARYAEQRGWSLELLSASPGEHGGYREVIARVAGRGAYGRLKFESGAHRVQRVPETESQGRIHTSACTVAVLPEPEEIGEVTVDPNELRVDTFRASGAGGQHVNKTDSAIRVTHLPTGIVVECQEERSQHKNRAKALALLQARLYERERVAREQARATERRLQVGSGDRSERVRTYNFPQGRVTDHRINLTLYKLESVLEGEALDEVIDALAAEHHAEQLAELAREAH